MAKKATKTKSKSKAGKRYHGANKRANGSAQWSGADARRKSAKAAGGNGRGARSQTLPGMERVRDGKLDNLCEALGEVRATMNNAKQEEAGLIQATLQRMVSREVMVYKHAGVELARVPGAEKVRVRLTKEKGDAGAEDLEVNAETDEVGDARREAVEELPAAERGIGNDQGVH